MNIRTRFAPSPTGYVHVGNIRTALFAFLVARQDPNGKFILRIEDTDEARFVSDAEELILKTLTALDLNWDEGPTLGEKEIGDFAPYHQTARRKIYEQYARKLIAKGRAYIDERSSGEISELRAKYDSHSKSAENSGNGNQFRFRAHRPTEVEEMAFDLENNVKNPENEDYKKAKKYFENLAENWQIGQTLRFLSHPKNYSWHDEIMGDLKAGEDAVDDFIVIKTGGLPTYNFAHIVDDHEMKITHVIRGQEFISSMPNYLNMYDALEISRPIFAHAPYILASNGNKKLGKRDGAKSVTEYFSDGFIREALLNFIASMGWNDGTEQEIFSLEELIEKFSLSRVQKSGARFDEKRLIWLNGQWIRKLNLDDLYNRCADFWGENGKKADENFKKKILKIVQERMKTLRDLPNLTEYFFVRPNPNWQMINENKQLAKIPRNDLLNLLEIAHEKLAKLSDEDFKNTEILQNILNELLAETETKPMILFSIIRFALTWAAFSPGLPETISVLGRNETLARIKIAKNSAE